MTETALNERIAELQENESEAAHQRQKARRRLRRGTNIRKTDDLLRIINYGGYAPHRGYINWGFSGRTLLHTGKYIKYPKNSNCQRWIAPTYRIALLDKPTIVWDFHSLLIGLQMMFSFMMAEDKTPLRMCDSCDTIFVAKRSNQRFCCDKCRVAGAIK